MGRASSSRSERRPRLQLNEELENHPEDHYGGTETQGPALPADGKQEPNPLASLLDYDEDSDEGEEQEEAVPLMSEAAGAAGAAPASQCEPAAPEPGPGSSPGAATGGLQAQLDSFLSELASSGLLGEQGAGEAAQQHASHQHGQRQEQAAAAQRQEERPATAPVPATGTERAEQRVLREVDGAEGWVKVLDTGSGHSYYWKQETGQVRWTPPEGALEEAAGAEQQPQPLPPPRQPGSQPASAPASGPASRGASPAPGSPGGQVGGAGGDDLPSRLLAAPSPAALEAAEAAAQSCEEAAAAWLASCPRVLQLAIEARSMAALLALLAARQAAAAERQDAHAALTWRALEDTLSCALAALRAQVPAALAAAGQRAASAGGVADAADAALEQEPGQQLGPAGEEQHRAASEVECEEEGELSRPEPVLSPARLPAEGAESPQPLALPAAPQLPGAAELAGKPPLQGRPPLPEELPPPLPALPPPLPPALPPLPDVAKRKGVEGGGGGRKAKRAVLGPGLASKAAGSLMNKWAALQREAREEEEAAARASALADDPLAAAEAAAAVRAREAEDWRLSQLRSGAADQNPNFAPLPEDWRQKVARRANGGSGSVLPPAGPAGPTPAPAAGQAAAAERDDGPPDLDALTAALPPGWQAMWSEQHRRVYFGHLQNQETRWDSPVA